ncbi:MAG: hypothetical protein Q9214_004849 [Letrouitia sp. 1 TL-2023]
MTSVQQQVLQEIYEEHGPPNEAEKDLLMIALRVDRESLGLWCQFPLDNGYSKANRCLLVEAKSTWGISVIEGENSGFHRVREVNRGPETASYNNSVDDVVSYYCHGIGFIHHPLAITTGASSSEPTSDPAVLSMAASVQQPSSVILPAVEVPLPTLTDDHHHHPSVPSPPPVPHIQVSGSGSGSVGTTERSIITANNDHHHHHLGPMLPAAYPYPYDDLGSPTLDECMKVGTLPGNLAAADILSAAEEDAYNPFGGGDPFDAFNISEWINPEAFD